MRNAPAAAAAAGDLPRGVTRYVPQTPRATLFRQEGARVSDKGRVSCVARFHFRFFFFFFSGIRNAACLTTKIRVYSYESFGCVPSHYVIILRTFIVRIRDSGRRGKKPLSAVIKPRGSTLKFLEEVKKKKIIWSVTFDKGPRKGNCVRAAAAAAVWGDFGSKAVCYT